MPDQKYTAADVGKLVQATKTIEEDDFNGKKVWRHANKGDYGRITYIDRQGHPSVQFEATGTTTVVFDEEIALANEKDLAEDTMVHTFFGHKGMCGCDGAIDDGCPICTDEKRQAFLKEFRELVHKYC